MRTRPVRRRPRPLSDLALHLRRHPRHRHLLGLLLAAGAALVVQRSVAAGQAERDGWGRSVEVVVATRDVAAGEALGPGAVERRDLPRALVPPGALSEVGPDRTARGPLYEGEIVLAGRVAPDGLTGVAARVPAGHRAVAVPLGAEAAPPLEVGDRVDVLVAVDPAAAGGGPPGFAVAEGVLVVDVGEDAVTVAVARPDAARVAVAMGQGLVTLALVGA
ncbi:MAG: SAF domain-containing protein [Acidimicrobiia bacterium]